MVPELYTLISPTLVFPKALRLTTFPVFFDTFNGFNSRYGGVEVRTVGAIRIPMGHPFLNSPSITIPIIPHPRKIVARQIVRADEEMAYAQLSPKDAGTAVSVELEKQFHGVLLRAGVLLCAFRIAAKAVPRHIRQFLVGLRYVPLLPAKALKKIFAKYAVEPVIGLRHQLVLQFEAQTQLSIGGNGHFAILAYKAEVANQLRCILYRLFYENYPEIVLTLSILLVQAKEAIVKNVKLQQTLAGETLHRGHFRKVELRQKTELPPLRIYRVVALRF
jgi:hypothetical protein